MNAALPIVLLVSLSLAGAASAQEQRQVLLSKKIADNGYTPVLVCHPEQGHQVLAFAREHSGDRLDATFRPSDDDGDVREVEFDKPGALTTEEAGRRVIRLWGPEAGGVRREFVFAPEVFRVRKQPPGWVLLDIDGKTVDVGTGVPLVIESPLPVESQDTDRVLTAEWIDGKAGTATGGGGAAQRRSLLEDPDTANKLVERATAIDSGLDVLKDIHFAVKAFDTEDGETALGFSYDWSKTLTREPSPTSTTYEGFEFELVARGNVCFDPDVNPVDFLDTKAKYRWFRSTGGVRDDLPPPTQAELEARHARLDRLARLGDDFKRSRDFAQHSADVRRAMTPQLHFDVGLAGGLEANQTFTARNYTYGLEAVVDAKVWDPNDPWCHLNVLDIPFAVVRVLTDYDDEFTIRGSTLPTFLVAIDQVEPDGSDPRSAVGDDSSYGRLRGEVSFRTPIAWIRDSQTFFDANYRIWHELGASDAVEAAGLDTCHFVMLSITTDVGFLVAYTRGQLPFDVADGESVQVGWAFNL